MIIYPCFFFPLAVEKPLFNQEPRNKQQEIILNYLRNEVTKIVKHSDGYNSTIAMAHHFLRTQIKSDGLVQQSVSIIYPSAVGIEVSNRVTYNLAMSPEVFDANYKIVQATVYSLSNEETHYQLNPLNVARIKNDGQLIWEHSFKEMLEKSTIKFKRDF